ncbi:unnamed protein product, partial [Lymnaea stagnalis]
GTPGPYLTKFAERVSVRIFNVTSTVKYVHGGLELSLDQHSWGFPCQEHFDTKTGQVVCRMFNYQRGEVISLSLLGTSANTKFPHSFDCQGDESSLDLCSMTELIMSCGASESVGVICFNNSKDVLEMRVASAQKTPIQVSGLLEVRLTPLLEWGTVCDDVFTDNSATSACKYMGYKHGEFGAISEVSKKARFLLDEVSCQVDQEFLDCDHDTWGQHDCSVHE